MITRAILAGSLALAPATDVKPIAKPAIVDLAGPWHARPAAGHAADVPSRPASGPLVMMPTRWHRAGIDADGAVWFSRKVGVPVAGEGWLEFDGADYFTDAWLDGRHVGFHEGGSAPFRFSLGPVKRGTHALTVRVDSPLEPVGRVWSLHKRLLRGVANHHDARPGGAWSPSGQDANSGGVWGDVRLRLAGPTVLDSPIVSTHIKGDVTTFRSRVKLSHRGPARKGTLQVRLAPRGMGGLAWFWQVPVNLRSGDQTLDVVRNVNGAKLWWPWDHGRPDRYDLSLKVIVDGQVSDHREQAVGLREVGLRPDGTWIVNGRRAFLRGVNYISSPWPQARDEGKLRADAGKIRAMNANVVRVHAHVEPAAFYDACDANGLLVWQDLPLQWGYSDDVAVRNSAQVLAREVVQGYGAHPSIIAWCGHNEAPYDASWMTYKYPDYNAHQNEALDDAIVGALREADPSRYIHRNSSTAEHPWYGWYSGTYRDYARKPAPPLVTEFGAQALPALESLAKFIPANQRWPQDERDWRIWEYHNFQRNEGFKIAGIERGPDLNAWIANSQDYQARLLRFAAGAYRVRKYAPVGAIFQFQFADPWPSAGWGMVADDRRPKSGYFALREAYQPLAPWVAVETDTWPAGTPVVVPLRVINDLDQASPQATLQWQLLAASGSPLAAGATRLDVPPDAVVPAGDAALPALPAGEYQLRLRLERRDVPSPTETTFRFTCLEQRP